MADSYLINTGNPRSVTGHVVSGAFASVIISGTVNYRKYQNDQISYAQALQNTVKVTAQGSIAAGAAISATNHLGPNGGGLLKALTALSIGMAGIYAVEIADQSLTNKISENANAEEALESGDTNETELDDESIITNGA